MHTTIKLSWQNIINDVLILTKQIKNVNTVLTIGRGGTIPGTLIGYELKIKDIINFGVQSYTEDKVAGRFQIQQEPTLSLLRNKQVLVVDDLSDKGATLKYVCNYLNYNRINYDTCTLYIKEDTTFIPKYYTKAFRGDEWIQFPWDDLSVSF